ncbi:helix-turn-helix domain-containing protein [Rhodoblastus sp.]|uniref:helix-turn-helix domain-containing protein n=1 Tax=Rhodoblastus sp. TaxID=1962975 RepID=UPI003F9888CF
MSEFGERLMNAAKEARQIARGEADPSTYRVHVPDEIDVKAIRKRLGMTQEEFGFRFGFGKRVRDWEQKRKRPDAATRAFLIVISKEPDAVKRALETAA